jgi:D-serine deaminase-like pyridoxal phosphate-dependent protein
MSGRATAALPAALARHLTGLAPTDKNWGLAIPGDPGTGWDLSLAELPTPLFTLDVEAMAHNLAAMREWAGGHGAQLAPHGKTTMCPALWDWQLAEGCVAITVANEAQLRVAQASGIPSVIVANELVNPAALRWLAGVVAEDFDVTCWVDSLDAVERMSSVLTAAGARRPVGVCVEVGVAGGRAGARNDDAALAIARAVRDAPDLELRGVAGFEGSVPRADPATLLDRVQDFLVRVGQVFTAVAPLAETDVPMISAGGSMYFDLVVAELGAVAARTPGARLVLRSGAYVVHDDGIYRIGTPAATRSGPEFVPAAHVWAQVLSVPEPGLALLDVGKRDVPYDTALPEVQRVWRDGVEVTVPTQTITALADQHAFVSGSGLRIGDLVRLGLSHPCTVFDKWRTALLVSGEGVPRVRGAVPTYF